MWRRRLLKPYAIYSTAVLLVGMVSLLLCSLRLQRELFDQAFTSLQEEAALVRELVQSTQHAVLSMGEPWSTLQGRLERLADTGRVRITVISADGTVLADSHRLPASMEPHLHRPEILTVRSHGEGRSLRRSETLGVEMMYYAVPLSADQEAYVRTSIPVSLLEDRISRQRKPLLWAIGAGVMAALAAGFVLMSQIARPVEELTKTAQALAAGNYHQRSPISGDNDFGPLSQALNQIAENASKSLEDAGTDRGRLLTVLSGMTEGVLAVDRDERVIQVNEAAVRILSASREGMVGRPIWEVTRVREVSQALSNTLRTSSASEAELRIAARNQDREVQMRTAPLYDAEGLLVGALLVLNDISHLQQLERMRRDFVANVSHELKTPIAAIKGLVETLIDDQQMSAENQHRFLDKIKNQVERLSFIVSDLLTLSRLESSEGLLDRKPLDLRGVVSAASQGVLQEGEEQGVQVKVELTNGPVMVCGDEKGLAQIVRNLLDNALKHTPAGGELCLRLGVDQGQAVLEVQDTGVGIELQDQARIFERFYRVDKARSRAEGGTGLGLSIVKHVALVHQGSVSVESTPGRGSCFRVGIPLHGDGDQSTDR